MEETDNYIKIDSALLDTSNLQCYNSHYEQHWPDTFRDHGFIASRWYKWQQYCYIVKGVKKHDGVCHERLNCKLCEPFERFLQTHFMHGAKLSDITSKLDEKKMEYVVEIFAWESICNRIFVTIFPVPAYHLIINPIRIYPTLEEINSQWEEHKREIIVAN